MEASPDPVVVVDDAGTVLLRTLAAQELLGSAASPLHLGDLLHPEDRVRFDHLAGELERCRRASAEWRMAAPDGTWRDVEVLAAAYSGDPLVGGHVLAMRDVSDRKRRESALAQDAMHDAPTGLFSSALFLDHLVQQRGRRRLPSRKCAVLVVDVAEVADLDGEIGEGAGDALVAELGARLIGAVRAEDTVARLERRQLALMLADVHEDDVDRVAQRILGTLARSVVVGDREVCVLATVGVSAEGPDLEQPGRLLEQARSALGAAKLADGCFVERYRPHARWNGKVSR